MARYRKTGWLIASAALLFGCTSSASDLSLPRIDALAQGIYVEDLADLDARATAVAIVQATGKSRIEVVKVAEGVPGTPFPVVELRVIETIRGKLPETIELRQGYTYENDAGERVPVVSGPGQFLLYLEPFSFGDGAPWNGQWVTSAWLSGVYMDLGRDSGTFTRVDPDATTLPDTITATEALDPASVQAGGPTEAPAP